MKKILILSLLFLTTNSFSQYYKDYDWSKNPKTHLLSAEENKESSIAILKKNIVEYKQSALTNEIRVFETTHNIIRVNDDAGISRHNQIYIPMYRVKNLKGIKARTISKDGKITNLDENNIKQIENVEEYGDFQIFAIEGTEIGSEVEVLYTVEKEFSPFGNETLQSDYPIKRFEMVFITNGLEGDIKTYNTTQKFERTYLEGVLVKELVLTDILPIIEEDYATAGANKIYAAYQCFGNPNITQDLLWGNTVGNVAQGFFPEQIEESVINEIRTNVLPEEKEYSDYEKVARVDNYIKSNFTVVENRNPQLEEIDYILKNRTSSDFGILKAYAHFIKAMAIDYEIVVTANRFEHRFDPEFYNPNALRAFLIYIPSLKQYISPDRIDYRLSEAPSNILGNNGLFINKDIEYYFAKITQSDPDYSRIKRIMDINFSEDFDQVTVDENQEYYGHWGVQNRAFMALAIGQQKADFEDYLTGSGIEDKKVVKLELENTDMNQTEYNLPYIVKSTIESSALLEEAGDSYIFQVGKVIGTQSELYQERERIHPIEMQYPNKYNYTITVDIPDGYKLEGLESLQINKRLEIEGNLLCKFESDYEIKNDKIVITIEEVYSVNEFPKENYEEFRQVINAASDFNKAVILFSSEE
ncbi:DUF3857 domain-containing protein [Urechidicola croceus]|uniref:DUF3857 domain-containing protein n=1 Tax=Urechidicola croceus TaxID=1850246 RepID=A0A1D8P6P5_9FLAO|nr:DUF3857 domain-containing protein [Urechidicola croceus]AOW20234.1 hypothetical protein LPB138_05885 [Urechidicola croceus]